MEPEGSLPYSQVPAACPYPEPDRSSPCSHIPLTENPSAYEYSENKSHLVGPFRSMPGSLPSSVLLTLIHWEGVLQRLALQRSKSHGRLLGDNVITRGPMEVRW